MMKNIPVEKIKIHLDDKQFSSQKKEVDNIILEELKKQSQMLSPVDDDLIDPSDPVLIEREIMKFKPGLS